MKITFDHETHLIARGALAPKVVCTSWIDQGKPRLELWKDTPARDWLADPRTTYDGANVAYDLTVQMASDHELIWPIIEAYTSGRVSDVQLDSKLLAIATGRMYEGRSFSLRTLAADIGLELEKDDWRLRYGSLDGVPIEYWPQGARDYALWDAIATDAVRANISKREADLPFVALGQHAHVAAAADHALHLASCWGVCTDSARVETLAERINAQLAAIRSDLTASGLLRPNGKRNDLAAATRMIEAMTRAGRRRSIALADAGQEILDRAGGDPAVHEKLLGETNRGRSYVKLDRDCAILSGDELLVARADWVSSSLLLGRAERLRMGVCMPLQTRFDSVKETFRTSSQQPRGDLVGEQMQNFPKGDEEIDLRAAFTPRRPDFTFIGGDFHMAELCSLSELTYKLFGYSRMGELINAHVDLHWHFAASSLGISIEECKALGKTQRNRAKPANFGFPGGMGPEKFVLYSRKGYGVIFTVEEVKPLKQKWLNTFPEVRRYLSWIGDQCAGGSWTSIHPITGYVRGGLGYTDGANHGFQHHTAYAAKVALIEVNAGCFDPRSPLFGYRIWDYVHDEILLEGPRETERASNAAHELARVMSTCFNRFCPTFPTHVDAWVSQVWTKNNETVRDAHGRIIECVSP